MSTVTQHSFAGGELAPALHARVDTVKYATGLRTCRNAYIMKHGGAANRAGTSFVGEAPDSTTTQRLIPFIFNADQAYVLQFSQGFMRVIKNGAQVCETGKIITAITNANPAVLTIAGHGYVNGDELYFKDIVGMTQLNNRNFKVYGVTTNTFQLKYMDGTTVVDSTSFGVFASGGTANRVYTIVSPYLTADLPDLHFTQSADVMTIVHPNWPPKYLKRLSDTSWTLTDINFSPKLPRPGNFSGSGTAGSSTQYYQITAFGLKTFEESLPGIDSNRLITAATQANPVVITSNAHGIKNGDSVYIQNVLGMTQLNNRYFIASNVTANTLELTGEDGSGYPAFVFGPGTIGMPYLRFDNVVLNSTYSITVNFASGIGTTEAVEYNIYRRQNGIFGFIGTSSTGTFVDTFITPDLSDTPPIESTVFSGANNYPSTVTYIQQRQAFGSTNNDPEKVWLSRTGFFNNFTTTSPIRDDNAISFVMSGRQVNKVRHLMDMGELVLLTTGGEHGVPGDSAGVLKPTELNPKQYTYNGSSNIAPILLGHSALFIQARGSIIRDLSYNFQARGYVGNDLTVFATHMFNGFTVKDWAYQQNLDSIVWVVRSDGTLLGLTYVKEQEIVAWHRHDFSGTVENVCAIPEGNEDAVYIVVKRTVNGRTVRYTERLSSRLQTSIENYNFTDCSLSYDGRNTDTSKTMTISGGTTWAYDETLTLTSNASYFTAAMVGNSINITGPDGSLVRFTITGYTSGLVVTGKPDRTVPVSMRGVACSTFARAAATMSGLWHLEGQKVSVLADGFVASNPNDPNAPVLTVTNGTIILDRPYAVVHVGLPFISDLETLNIDTAQGETLADKNKMIGHVTLHVDQTRGVWVGGAPPSNDSVNPIEGLTELKIRQNEGYDQPTSTSTGVVDLIIQPQWNSNGRVFIRQIDPLPMAILAVSPGGYLPFRGQ